MLRKIVKIDESRCNGCGLCVSACAEGALELVNGKARLVKESFCDGLGACLPKCPTDAISIEVREADEFDEGEVKERLVSAESPAKRSEHSRRHAAAHAEHHSGSCPGSAVREMRRRAPRGEAANSPSVQEPSQLTNWPVQLRLVPPSAAFLKGADILISADCVPFARADFHTRYLSGRAVLVGCPKLDDLSLYAEKLKEIFKAARPNSITVVRMEVPCCGGIADAVTEARDAAAPETPVTIETVSIGGEIIGKENV